uniref:Uncharacterized protein n=1 Tax=Ditylum brightwellii TaxID=49249 RepID=A0A7S1YNA9_9STRA|mmetsp:Transcript_11722/g.17486  ORF Transcript_11722/g.17486 Transcript_11722/m.17486 type:complete len:175 (+) Transcript_11722:214-738(+)
MLKLRFQKALLQFFTALAIIVIGNVRSFSIHPLKRGNHDYVTIKSISQHQRRLQKSSFAKVALQWGLLIHPASSSSNNADSNSDDVNDNSDQSEVKSSIEEELERLQQMLTSIEALEERNKAQLDSFVDEEDQWNSLEEFERELLGSKEETIQQMENISEELLQMWMGAKSMEG